NGPGVYVLKLEDGCWFVGLADNISETVALHREQQFDGWTQAHKASQVVTREMAPMVKRQKDLARWERLETMNIARQHGVDRVRGYNWTGCYLTDSERQDFVRAVRHHIGVCERCGKGFHVYH
ncbi:unnamed protein product, partial [Ectocarpus sp. 13 AM-2016]